jgi:histidinol dehydrogenase
MMNILKLTEANIGKVIRVRRAPDKAAEGVAARIVNDVRKGGDRALLAWTKKLDGAELDRGEIWVSRGELRAARRAASADLIRALEHAAKNIRRVAERQKPQPWKLSVESGVHVAQIVRPLRRIGCYVPGGRFSLLSTLLMTVIPAQVAGVPEIVVASPRPNAALLAAADFLGVSRLARVGGAQAIAAFAYGTESIPRVNKIFGPGNRYVTAAKRLISSDCAIDRLAGPTELLIVSARGNPRYIAADLLAQAEHDPDAVALLVTPSRKLAVAVRAEVLAQLDQLPKNNPAWRSIQDHGAILMASGMSAAIRFANEFAPEHLSLPDGDEDLIEKINSAGSVFLGNFSAQPLGDYATGTNHVLPTAGWAAVEGGLSTADFMKCFTVQKISREGFAALAPTVKTLAGAEGLLAHARAIEVRE